MQSNLPIQPGYESNNARVENSANAEDLMSAMFSRHTREQPIALLEAANITHGRLSDLDVLRAHPQNLTLTIQGEAGDLDLPAPPVIIDKSQNETLPPLQTLVIN